MSMWRLVLNWHAVEDLREIVIRMIFGMVERGGVSHSPIGTPGTCGDANANRVITSEGGTFQSVGEFNGEQGWLNGKMTHWIDKGQPGVIDPGDIIFWYTESGFGSNKRKWNHWGYVEQQDSSHPNHS